LRDGCLDDAFDDFFFVCYKEDYYFKGMFVLTGINGTNYFKSIELITSLLGSLIAV